MEAGTKLILVQQPAHFGVQSLPWDDPATLDELRVLTSFKRGNPTALPPKVHRPWILAFACKGSHHGQVAAACRWGCMAVMCKKRTWKQAQSVCCDRSWNCAWRSCFPSASLACRAVAVSSCKKAKHDLAQKISSSPGCAKWASCMLLCKVSFCSLVITDCVCNTRCGASLFSCTLRHALS